LQVEKICEVQQKREAEITSRYVTVEGYSTACKK
jgi:hypothetical protein